RPITVKGRPKALKNFTSASGWLSTFASFTISPVASTMHTLESSKETSISGIVVHGGRLPLALRCLGPGVTTSRDPVHHHLPGDSPLSLKLRGEPITASKSGQGSAIPTGSGAH